MVHVRLATDADVPTVVATVVSAFATDPAWGFIVGDAGRPAMEAFARTLLLGRLRRGTAWMTDDGAAVALWDRRAGNEPADADHEARWADFRAAVGDAVWSRLSAYDDAVGAVGPVRPYWYLGVLATAPPAQGRGLASAVLQPAFAAAAADGWDCWLETSVPANKTFYAGRGFGDPVTVDVPGGPTTWWLCRRHRSA